MDGNDERRFEEWAVVELMGHQRIAGKTTEQTIAGAALLRVDVPAVDGQAAFTRFFGPSAIYSIIPTTEQIARRVAASLRAVPISRFDLPALPAPATEGGDDSAGGTGDDDDDDDDRYYGNARYVL